MSKTTAALMIKMIINFAAGWITLRAIDGNNLGWILAFALIGTIMNYLLGELFTLPTYGDITSSICAGIMAAVIAYIIDLFIINFSTRFTTLVFLAAIVTAAEYLFHRFLIKSEEAGM